MRTNLWNKTKRLPIRSVCFLVIAAMISSSTAAFAGPEKDFDGEERFGSPYGENTYQSPKPKRGKRPLTWYEQEERRKMMLAGAGIGTALLAGFLGGLAGG